MHGRNRYAIAHTLMSFLCPVSVQLLLLGFFSAFFALFSFHRCSLHSFRWNDFWLLSRLYLSLCLSYFKWWLCVAIIILTITEYGQLIRLRLVPFTLFVCDHSMQLSRSLLLLWASTRALLHMQNETMINLNIKAFKWRNRILASYNSLLFVFSLLCHTIQIQAAYT